MQANLRLLFAGAAAVLAALALLILPAAAGPVVLGGGPITSSFVTLAPPPASSITILAPPAAAPAQATTPAPETARVPDIDPRYLPATVAYSGAEPVGTIIVDTITRYLYLILPGGQARRWGVGIGREGFGWTGVEYITRKAEWPGWTPPAEMRERQPDLPLYVPGGPDNPLGARALYLGTTLYRIHGTNEPWTIGQAVSSGCFRMRNEDVIELYGLVSVGTRVVVI